MKRIPRLGTIVFVAVACAVYLPQLAPAGAAFFAHLVPAQALLLASAVAKLVCIVFGVAYGFRVVRVLERSNPARRPWAMLVAWLALWAFSQLTLMVYEVFLGPHIPVPSVADVGFLVGFVFLFWAQIAFIVVYRRSGFPIGSARQHALLAAAALAVVTFVSYPILAPIARDRAPGVSLVAHAINVAYPALDLLAVVPAVVLLRIALAFRPGRVWAVWSALVTGLVLMAVGDFISTYVWPRDASPLEPAIHLTYLLGYYFAALGMKLQHELVATPSGAPSR